MLYSLLCNNYTMYFTITRFGKSDRNFTRQAEFNALTRNLYEVWHKSIFFTVNFTPFIIWVYWSNNRSEIHTNSDLSSGNILLECVFLVCPRENDVIRHNHYTNIGIKINVRNRELLKINPLDVNLSLFYSNY